MEIFYEGEFLWTAKYVYLKRKVISVNGTYMVTEMFGLVIFFGIMVLIDKTECDVG
jgi:hypothetical protein